MSPTIPIEVVYALPHRQQLVSLTVPEGTNAQQAVLLSGLTEDLLAENIHPVALGLFGEAFGSKGLPPAEEYRVQPGDRIEIYRPLLGDPKEVRRRRATQQ